MRECRRRWHPVDKLVVFAVADDIVAIVQGPVGTQLRDAFATADVEVVESVWRETKSTSSSIMSTTFGVAYG